MGYDEAEYRKNLAIQMLSPNPPKAFLAAFRFWIVIFHQGDTNMEYIYYLKNIILKWFLYRRSVCKMKQIVDESKKTICELIHWIMWNLLQTSSTTSSIRLLYFYIEIYDHTLRFL